jgi:hypothetical protein
LPSRYPFIPQLIPNPIKLHSTMALAMSIELMHVACDTPLQVAGWIFCCPCCCLAHCYVWTVLCAVLGAMERADRPSRSWRGSGYSQSRQNRTTAPNTANQRPLVEQRTSIEQVRRRDLGPVGPTGAQSAAARRSLVPPRGLPYVSTVVDYS